MNQQSSSDDYPPNSINLKKEEELDWLSKTGGLFERNHSTKPSPGRSISHSHSRSTSASQSFFTNLKFGLSKPQNSSFVARRNAKPTTSTKSRLVFPKRSRSTSAPLSEPSSPKVSCIGRVRSTKESFVAKSRSFRFRNSIRSVDDESKKNIPSSSSKFEINRNGFWSNLRSVFRIGGNKKKNLLSSVEKKKISKAPSEKVVVVGSLGNKEPSSAMEPPSLGDLKRFTSGRKSESMEGSELGLDDESGEFEPAGDRGSVFCRRLPGQPMEIDCSDRDWVSGGPATV